jgi:hypothetical protein
MSSQEFLFLFYFQFCGFWKFGDSSKNLSIFFLNLHLKKPDFPNFPKIYQKKITDVLLSIYDILIHIDNNLRQ